MAGILALVIFLALFVAVSISHPFRRAAQRSRMRSRDWRTISIRLPTERIGYGLRSMSRPSASRRSGGEAERTTHHEGGIDDARGEAQLALLDVAHRRQQHRVEGETDAEAEKHHARQDVHHEIAVDRCKRERGNAEGDSARPSASGQRIPKRITTLADRLSEKAPMMMLDGRKAIPSSSAV